EACPTQALHLTQENELADFTRDSFIYARDRLVNQHTSDFTVPVNVYPAYNGWVPMHDGADGRETGRGPQALRETQKACAPWPSSLRSWPWPAAEASSGRA